MPSKFHAEKQGRRAIVFSKRVFEVRAFFDAQKVRGRWGKRREENGFWVPRRPKTEEEEEGACFVPKKKFRLLHAQDSTDGLSKKKLFFLS